MEPHLSEAQWQLPFHLGSPVFNCPHYVINLANLPLALKAQLRTLPDRRPSQSHSITGKKKTHCQRLHLGQPSRSAGKFSSSSFSSSSEPRRLFAYIDLLT